MLRFLHHSARVDWFVAWQFGTLWFTFNCHVHDSECSPAEPNQCSILWAKANVKKYEFDINILYIDCFWSFHWDNKLTGNWNISHYSKHLFRCIIISKKKVFISPHIRWHTRQSHRSTDSSVGLYSHTCSPQPRGTEKTHKEQTGKSSMCQEIDQQKIIPRNVW